MVTVSTIFKTAAKASAFRFSQTLVARTFLSRWKNAFAVLCLHRVLPQQERLGEISPNDDLSISCEFFDELLTILSKQYRFCTLDEIVQNRHLSTSVSDLPLLHLTFDDGYVDNLLHALPILEKHSAPATVYVTTSFLDDDPVLWWAELWECAKLASAGNRGHINALSPAELRKARKAYLSLSDELRSAPPFGVRALLTDHFQLLPPRSLRRITLNWQQCLKLARHPLIEIGSHTVTHGRLSCMRDDEISAELARSKARLERELEMSIRHFAYPYGGRCDYSEAARMEVGNAGYQSAVTTMCRPTMQVDPFAIPRFFVTERGGALALQARLAGLSNVFERQLLG